MAKERPKYDPGKKFYPDLDYFRDRRKRTSFAYGVFEKPNEDPSNIK
jgi:hypothetical protein